MLGILSAVAGAWKPVTLVVGLIAGTAVGVQCVHRAAIFTRADGRPLDWAGDGIRCQVKDCDGSLRHLGGYNYGCSKCGESCRARWDMRNHVIVFEDVEAE